MFGVLKSTNFKGALVTTEKHETNQSNKQTATPRTRS